MDAIEFLVAQHRDVEEQFKVIAAERDPVARHAEFLKLAQSLTLHTRLEEELIYPELRTAGTDLFIHHAYDDHAHVGAELLQLAKLDPSRRTFDAYLVEVRLAVEAHVAEEQAELFPYARQIVGQPRLDELGELLQRRMNELLQHDDLPVFESVVAS